jgi:hypothetical protein
MKKKYFYIIGILLITVFGCEKPSGSSVNLDFKVYKIIIPLNDDNLNSYQTLHAFQEQNKNFLFAYNNRKHSLDYFDLDNFEVVKSLNLDYEGPNGVNQVSSIFYHNKDSIFLFERGALHVINSSGNVFDTFKLYDLFNVSEVGEPACNFYFKLNYNPSTKKVLFYLNNPRVHSVGDTPKVGSLDISSRTVGTLPIFPTPYYQSIDGRVGFITYLGFYDYFQGKILYNFQYESSLFLYDLETQDIQSSSGNNLKTKFVTPLPSSESPEIYDQHALENTHYLTLIPDKWRGLIYRINWEGISDSSGAGFTEKKQSISVFDENLNFIQEFPLPDNTYQINNWFVNEKGLYLNKAHPSYQNMSDDHMLFDLITFEKQ